MSGAGGGPGRGRRVGWGWMFLLALPPLLVAAGLVALFVWQGAKGGVRGKWQKEPAAAQTPAPAPAGSGR